MPIAAGECGIAPDWLTPEGDLRTLPYHLPNERTELAGLDGFYAARLVLQRLSASEQQLRTARRAPHLVFAGAGG